MTAQQFLKLIEQSSLLPQSLLGKLARKLAETPSVKDADGVARWMVEKGHLSVWQAQQLLAGRNAFYLGRYRLVERIGKGGMGVVFKAQHAVMDRVVALKIMSPSLLRNPRAVARFNREVKAAAALQHPNIITAYDADSVGNTHFLVMEYVDGHDLNWWLRKLGPLPASLAAECAMQAAEGLAHAHHLGMVHRDIKPVNLLVSWNAQTRAPLVKILDMGLARFVSESQEDGGLTRLGQAIGTPDYIAPEAAENFKQADIRADIFSLGCTLYKLLSGRLPFGGENTMEKLLARARNDAPPIRTVRPSVPEPLEAVLAKLLARQPDERYQTPSEVVEALRPFAASTLKEASSLQLLARPEGEIRPSLDRVVPEADSSLNLFRDLSVAPVREAGDAQGATLAEGFDFADASMQSPHTPSRSAPKVEALEPMTGAADVLLGEGSPDPDEELIAILDQVDPDSEGSFTERLKAAPESWESAPLRAKRSVWDSPLILVGGGLLALLLMAAVALAWAIRQGGGDQAFEAAEIEYGDGNYGPSIGLYAEYLEQYPRHPKVGQAKVRLSLARLRQAIDTSSNWAKTLDLARGEVESIAPLPEFAGAGNDLAVLLPRISAGLAADARKQPSAERIAQGRASLALIDKYVLPRSLQPADAIADVQKSLALAERDLLQKERLQKAVADIEKHAAAGDLAAADAARTDLLNVYPSLERAAELRSALAAMAEAARKATRFVAEPRDAETAENESPIAATTTIATRTRSGEAPLGEARVYALAEGAAYALAAADGRVLWRRFVGFASELTPSEQPDGTALVYDAVHRALASVDNADGGLRWRLSLSARPAGPPLALDDRTLVATIDGRLTALDPESGNAQGYTAFPQPIVGAPALEPRGRRLYQAGDHAHLFVLDRATLEGLEVVDLGYAASSVAVSPTVVSRYVIVAENHLANGCRLRVLVADDEGLNLKEVQQVELEGHVVSPPQVADRYLHVFTDRGGVIVLAVATSDVDQPLTKVIETVTGSQERGPSYARIAGRDLWIGNDRLTKFAVQAAAARIAPLWTIDRGDLFCQPPVVQGEALITARKRKAFSGVAMSAVRADDGQPLWETQLAAAPTDVVQLDEDASQLTTLSTTGGLFAVGLNESERRTVVDAPRARVELAAALPTVVATSRSAPWALAPALPAERLLRVEAGGSSPLGWMTPPGPALAPAVPWRDGWLVPCRGGLVQWIDAGGKPRAQPFQPRTEAGVDLPWTPGAPLENGDALISDGRAKLYRLTLAEKPMPHVAAALEVEPPEPLVSRIAAGPRQAFAVDAGGRLVGFSIDGLKLGPQIRLGGKPVWGPHRVGSLTLTATNEDRLLAVDDRGEPAFEITLDGGPLVGLPLPQEDSLLLALQSGRVLRISAADGQRLGAVDVGEPLGGGPLHIGERLIVLGHDGSVYTLRSAP